jgi:uncharacterized membrane protein YfcA
MLDPLPGLAGAVVGIALGLTGGGGSIFALPLLVHVLQVGVRDAVAVSLATVGMTALFGAALKRGNVQWRTGLLFAGCGVLGAPLGSWIGRQIPDHLTLLGFALLMIIAGIRMWRRPGEQEVSHIHPAILPISGFATGVLAGVFGVGGGFLIVPALVLGAGLKMREAVATSLFAIALISASALASQFVAGGVAIGSGLVTAFTAGALVGMFVGTSVRAWLSELALRRTFAVCMWGVATAMILR